MMISNRYTGEFIIAAHPFHPGAKVAMVELNRAELDIIEDDNGSPLLAAAKGHDTFSLSPYFKESDSGFKRQLLLDIKGITESDADTLVQARNALRCEQV